MPGVFDTPGFAMAMAAGQNLGNPYGPQLNPMQQYQNTVQMQAQQRQQQQMNEMNQQKESRLAEKQKAELDPFREYRIAVEQKMIDPEQVSYTDFQRINQRQSEATSPQKNYETWLRLNQDATEEQKRAAFDVMVRPMVQLDTGGGGIKAVTQGALATGGEGRQVVLPEEATRLEAELAGAREGATKQQQLDYAQVDKSLSQIDANEEAFYMAEQLKSASEEYLQQIESGNINTGVINGLILRIFGVGTEELAGMDATAIAQQLVNLQIVNLAPVTEKELQMIAGLWANILRSEEPNIGVLKQVISRTDRLMEKIKRQTKQQAGRIKSRNEGEYNTLLESNPFVSGFYEPESEEI